MFGRQGSSSILDDRIGGLWQGSIIGGLCWRFLNWLTELELLGLYVYGSVKSTSDLKVDHLHVHINCLHQLPHTRGVLLIGSDGLTLDRGRGIRIGNLLEIPQGRILDYPYHLQGSQPPLSEPVAPSLVDDWLHEVFGIRKAFIIPLLLPGL